MKTKISHKIAISLFAVGALAIALAQTAVQPARGQVDEPPPEPRHSLLPEARDAPDAPLDLSRTVITFQGRLTKANGEPINTPVQATFRIYSDVNPSLATTAIWVSNLRTITPTNGLFTVYLGDGVDRAVFGAPLAGAISVQIVPDALEMSPRQALNSLIGNGYTGVTGRGHFGVFGTGFTGVFGYGDDVGVFGKTESDSSTGVMGEVDNPNSVGVSGRAYTQDSTGVLAHNSVVSGTALQIERGAFRVRNAGVNSPTTAYVHVVTAGNTNGHITILNNSILNGNPRALVFITHNWNPPGTTAGIYNPHPAGVYYDGSHWTIFNEDRAAMPVNAAYNVFIIVP